MLMVLPTVRALASRWPKVKQAQTKSRHLLKDAVYERSRARPEGFAVNTWMVTKMGWRVQVQRAEDGRGRERGGCRGGGEVSASGRFPDCG